MYRRLSDVSEHYRTYRSTIGNVQIVDEGCAVAPSYRNYRTVTIGLSERPLSDYRSYRSTIGAISQYAVVDMGFLYVEHSWIQAVSFLIQRGLVYMHKPHNTCYITHSMHTQWLVCTRQLTHNHSLLPKAKQCHPDNTCDCFLLLDGFLDCVLTSDILPHDSVLARGGRVDKHISWSQRWCGGPQSL